MFVTRDENFGRAQLEGTNRKGNRAGKSAEDLWRKCGGERGRPERLRGSVAAVRGDTTGRSRFQPPAFRFPTPHGVAADSEMQPPLFPSFPSLPRLDSFYLEIKRRG